MSIIIRSEKGFSLIEVLISVLVLSIGLLGLSALQGFALKHTNTAYYRGQAVQLSYDMADRIRANVGYAHTTGGVYVFNTHTGTEGEKGSNCTASSPCSPQAMAQQDIEQWRVDVSDPTLSVLPQGVGDVRFNSATSIFTIKVIWDDNRDGCTNDSGGTDITGCEDKPTDPSFEMEFQL